MKLVIPGGSGHVGQVVARAFAKDGHEVAVLSRSASGAHATARVVAWDGRTLGPWVRELEGADALLNLAGHTVDCRYTPANRGCMRPRPGRFSIDVAKRWEAAFEATPAPRTRKLALRTAMTMSPTPGSVFAVLSRLARFGLGGPVAGGRQFVSWIHGDDFVNALRSLIARAVNLAARNPLPYAEFMRALRRAWGMPIGLPATRWMLEIAASCREPSRSSC